LDLKPITEAKWRIDGVLNFVSDKLPKWIIDYSSYTRGVKITADLSLLTIYKPIAKGFERLKKTKEAKEALIGVNTPRELMQLLSRKPNILDYAKRQKWNKVHGNPNCKAYATKLRERIEQMAGKDPIGARKGKRPMSAFAKAELDLRHEEQMGKLDKLVAHGYRLCWISSHTDCSPRCAPWQGKLVDIVHKSDLPSHRMPYKKDGYVVYSLKSIMEETDKYGYHNTIINGFNCRHRLIPYAKGSKPPRHVSEEERRREYAIGNKLREQERRIRYLKRKALLYNDFDKKGARGYASEAQRLTKAYKSFALAKGFTAHDYRLEV
jgi:hypothetical protein